MADTTRKPIVASRNVLLIPVAIFLIVFVLGVIGWVSATTAAQNYAPLWALQQTKLHATEKQAATASYSNLINKTAIESPAQYAAEQSSCASITASARIAAENTPAVSALQANLLAKIVGPLNAQYRDAQKRAKADAAAAGDLPQTLATHLGRLASACRVYDSDVSSQQQDYTNSAARAALIITNGEDGIACEDGADSCYRDDDARNDYKGLSSTLVASAKAQADVYASSCEYETLQPLCAAMVTTDRAYAASIQAYDDTLPNGDYQTAANNTADEIDKEHATLHDALAKTQPSLAQQALNREDGESFITFATVALMQQDEQSIHTTAQKLIQLR